MDIDSALAAYMTRQGLDVAEVVSFRDDTKGEGYCETCYYEYAVVVVEYRDSDGTLKTWTYEDSFADLIREL